MREKEKVRGTDKERARDGAHTLDCDIKSNAVNVLLQMGANMSTV